MHIIFIDADACPVKTETYKVAERYQWKCLVVANQFINIPLSSLIEMHVVDGNFDAADDWIVDQSQLGDIVITSDILLAERCIQKKAKVLNPKGFEFNEDNIGSAVSGRELSEQLRQMGHQNTGPSSMDKKDRSNFLAKLDQIIQLIKRQKY